MKPLQTINARLQADPSLLPQVVGVGLFETVGGVIGGVAGYTAAPGPNTSAIETQIDGISTKIDSENNAIDILKNDRPDTNGIIASTRDLIGHQKGEIQALQQQKKELVDHAPHHGPEYAGFGVLIGLGVTALILAGAKVTKPLRQRLSRRVTFR